jgi:hypothetical protein
VLQAATHVPAATQRQQKAFKTNTSFNPIPERETERETGVAARAAGKSVGRGSSPPVPTPFNPRVMVSVLGTTARPLAGLHCAEL